MEHDVLLFNYVKGVGFFSYCIDVLMLMWWVACLQLHLVELLKLFHIPIMAVVGLFFAFMVIFVCFFCVIIIHCNTASLYGVTWIPKSSEIGCHNDGETVI